MCVRRSAGLERMFRNLEFTDSHPVSSNNFVAYIDPRISSFQLFISKMGKKVPGDQVLSKDL